MDQQVTKAGRDRGILSERDDLLLRAVYDLHFMTAEQMTRLYFSPGSLTHVREILKNLSDAGYLHRLKMPSSQDGVKPFVYCLDRLGIRYLKAAGLTGFARFRPSEQAEHSFLFMAHTLGVNELIIGAKLLSNHAPQVVLADFLHERVLRHKPVMVSTAEDGKMLIVPDLWLDFHLASAARASVCFEYDRGTVSPEAWRRKIRGLLSFANGAYQEAFGSESLTIAIAVAASAGQRRAEMIRSWIEQELAKAGRKQDSEIFLVTVVPDGELNAQAFFLSPVWMQPFGSQPATLLEEEL